MQLSTKKCLLTYSGAIMFSFGFAMMILGITYFQPVNSLSSNVAATRQTPLVISSMIKAVPHWCGILLILLGARNFTFGFAQWKHGMNCCGSGACEVVFVNFLSLLVSLAAIGLSVYGSINHLRELDAAEAAESLELVHLISIWFMALITTVLSLLSMCAGCLPIGSQDGDEGMSEF